MDFSLTSLFVVPVGNTLPTTGSTESLTLGQFGIYKDKLRTAATAANVAAGAYIQIAQGRPATGLGTKLSDRIKASNVVRWEKKVGSSTSTQEIWKAELFTATKGEDLVVSWRVNSPLLEARHPNGLVQSVTIPGACLTCGEDPCAAVANETTIDAFFTQYNLQLAGQSTAGNAERLDSYVTIAKVGTGDTAYITFTAKAAETIATVNSDIATRNVDKAHTRLHVFAYKQPDTTADFYSPDSCSSLATITQTQFASYAINSSEEIKQMEVDFYSYQATQKSLYRDEQFNRQFASYVTDGTYYTLYFIQFNPTNPDSQVYTSAQAIDEQVIIAVPNGATTTIEAILVAYLGAVTTV